MARTCHDHLRLSAPMSLNYSCFGLSGSEPLNTFVHWIGMECMCTWTWALFKSISSTIQTWKSALKIDAANYLFSVWTYTGMLWNIVKSPSLVYAVWNLSTFMYFFLPLKLHGKCDVFAQRPLFQCTIWWVSIFKWHPVGFRQLEWTKGVGRTGKDSFFKWKWH